MKRILTLFLALFATGLLSGQGQRMVLVEHFTQASCTPCARVNPGFQALLNQNLDKTVCIRYQTSWPGSDPMNKHNPGQVRTRVVYYGVGAVPNSVLDGNGPESTNSIITQNNINTRYNTPASFKLEVQHEISSRLDEIFVTLTITALEDMDEDLLAHIVVTEKEIHFNSPPGSNGEKDFYNVMKQMLPSAAGTTLQNTWAKGESKTITASWKMENIYDIEHVAVVAFVQNPRTKVVHQAAISEPHFESAGAYDAIAFKSSGTGNFNINELCSTTTSPIIEIVNGGTTTLTSIDIKYSINGGAEKTYTWSGFLSSLKKTTVRLPDIDFTHQVTNRLRVELSNPNGHADVQTDNDVLVSEFYPSPQTTTTSRIETKPATAPGQLSWKLVDESGTTVAEDGPFTVPLSSVFKDVNLDPNACYELLAVNSSSSFNGLLRLYNDNDEEILSLNFLSQGLQRVDLGTYQISSANTIIRTESLSVYPIPADAQLTIEMQLIKPADGQIQLFNYLGQQVLYKYVKLPAGQNAVQLQTAQLPAGIYFINITAEGQQFVRKVIIE